jgi:lipid II:glycine glycyltransferase (peptidoglycan interpeptide bridge formation enzyme)
MSFLTDSPEVRERYAELLEGYANATVYQTLEWLDVFATLSCEIEFFETPKGAMVPFVCKGSGPMRRAFSLPYDTYGGPVPDKDPPLSFDDMVALMQTPSVRLVDFNGATGPTRSSVEEASTHVIDLAGGYERALSRYARMNRRALKQARQRGLRIGIVEDREDLKAFHRLYCLTSLKHRTRPLPLSFFEAIFDTMTHRNMATFYVARHGGGVIAGNLVLRYKDSAYDWAWAYDETYLYLRPTNALIDRAIRDEAAIGTALFNLGSSPSNGRGIVDFKENFGAERYSYRILTRFGLTYRMARSLRRLGVGLRR